MYNWPGTLRSTNWPPTNGTTIHASHKTPKIAPITVPDALKTPSGLPRVAPRTGAHAPQAAYWKNIIAPSKTRTRILLDIEKPSPEAKSAPF